MSRQPAVERQLGIDVQHALDVQDPARVAQRDRHPQRREVVDRVVQEQQPADRQQLDPPARARRRVPTRPQRKSSGRRAPGLDRSGGGQATDVTPPLSAARRGGRRRPASGRDGPHAASGQRREHLRQRSNRPPPRVRALSSRRRRAAAAPSRRPLLRSPASAIDSGVARASQSRPQWLHSSVRQPRALASRSADALSTPYGGRYSAGARPVASCDRRLGTLDVGRAPGAA